jgi:hypothetical protein
MKPKLILCLALVLSGGFISSRADVANDIASASPVKSSKPYRSFLRILDENGEKLGCSFTIEYRGYAVTGKESKANPFYTQYTKVRADLDADSIPSLLSKLRDYLDGFMVVQDSKNPKIIHIIDKVLAEDKNYALNKKINVSYSGLLEATNVPVMPITGHATLVGGLLPAVAEKAGDIRDGLETSGSSGFGGYSWDNVTQINVNATNETVRSIFTDCLPTANYNPVIWVAVTSKRNNVQNELVQCVLVHFFGPKKP